MATTANRAYPYPIASDNVRPYEDIQLLADAVDADVNPIFTAWTAYTPTLTADSGSPAAGTGGTLTGRYKQLGKTVHIAVQFLLGTGFVSGTGGWYLSLPVGLSARTAQRPTGAGYYRDTSAAGGGHFNGLAVVRTDIDASKIAFFDGNGHNQVGGSLAQPFAWAAADYLNASLTYEVA